MSETAQSSKSLDRRERLNQMLFEALLFASVLCLAQLYFKYSYLKFGDLDIATRALGLMTPSLIDYAKFAARDLLEALVVFPLVLALAGMVLPERWRVWTFLLAVEMVLFAGVVAFTSYHMIGRFPSSALVREFLATYRADPQTVAPTAVLSDRHLLKISVLLSLGAIPLLGSYLPIVRQVGRRQGGRVFAAVLALATLGAGALALAGTSTLYHAGHVQRMTTEFLREGHAVLPSKSDWTRSELRALYQQAAFPNGFAPKNLSSYPDVPAADSPPNVVILILETATGRDYDFMRADGPMPRTQALLPNALVARRHFTPYPYSVRANFSLLSSIYDLATKRTLPDHLLDVEPRPLDALPALLRKRGYHTAYYYPGTLHFASEASMLRYVGFDVVPAALAAGEQHPRQSDEQRVRHELEFFQRVNQGLSELSEREQPFLLVAATTLGHSPYPDVRPLRPEGQRGEPLALGQRMANLVSEVDRMVGSVIDQLQELDLLSRTILVITGDHGVRNISDDPTLDMRFTNRRSFHVPLLIHYPPAFPEPLLIDHVTSHVDITPTIVHLLGIDSPDYLHQGLPLYDQRIAERATFFLGGHYIGSNAVHYAGTFFMVNEVTQLAFSSDAFRFAADQLVTHENKAAAGTVSLRSQLDKLSKAQMALTAYLRAGTAASSHEVIPP